MMRVFMTMLCSLLVVGSVSARISHQEGTDGQAAIYRLPLFERAVRCTKYFEGWHSEKHHPYVGWGHKILPGEKYSARTMTKRQADELLRKDLRKFCAMFRQFGKDSLLLATLAYNVGPYRLLGSKTIPKSTLIKKLEAGDRNIYREYIAFCNYKGKRHAMLLKRRKAEFALLYMNYIVFLTFFLCQLFQILLLSQILLDIQDTDNLLHDYIFYIFHELLSGLPVKAQLSIL